MTLLKIMYLTKIQRIFNSKGDLYYIKDYSYIQMPRFLNSRFPGFCQFAMEKKEYVVEMKNIV